MKTALVWMAACGFGFLGGAALAGYGLIAAVKALVPEPTPVSSAGASPN